MKLIPRGLQRYFLLTQSLLYSYLISLPLLILYEILILVTQPDPSSVVRIAVDVWIKHLFQYFGYNTLSITLLLVALIGLLIFYRDRKHRNRIHPRYFLGMLLESVVYAVLLSLLISTMVTQTLQLIPPSAVEEMSTIQQIALSMGAGLYEELFFRVILVTLLYKLFQIVFSKKWQSYLMAALFGALIFSMAHYTGALGDPFTIGSFLYRFLFGLALNAIYLLRGFGLAAWTHASYDIMVVAFI